MNQSFFGTARPGVDDKGEVEEKPGQPEQDLKTDANEWITKLKEREREFEQGWWKEAQNSADIYGMEKDSPDTPYNILYSNTEVLLPSLYSSTAKPEIRPRIREMRLKPIPDLLTRYLTVFSDPAVPGEENLDSAMQETVLSALTAAAGFVRIRYYPERPMPIVAEAGHYRGILWQKARKWSRVNWVAFRHELSKEELFAQFQIPAEEQYKYEAKEFPGEGEGKKPLGTVVYEVWDKLEREVYFICEDWQDKLITSQPDMLKLQGFYPLPGILSFVKKPGQLVPATLYGYYKAQATELNRVTARLNKVLEAIKVRGAYHGLLGDELKNILSSEDTENALVPASEAGFLAQMGGFDKAIWLLPLEKLVQVATQLYGARQQIKQVIYELTGISDIIRGSSLASETATAQDLKNKWGTVRLRKMQSQVANYVRDLFRLSVDAATSTLMPQQWLEITQMQIPTAQQQAVAQQQVQYLQQQVAMMGPPPVSGQPPQPPQVPPQIQQQMQQAQQILSQPSIEQIIQRIASDANRSFTINIQSNTTIDADTTEDKQEVGEFLNALGQFLPSLPVLGQLGPKGFDVAKQFLLEISRRFKFGNNLIDTLETLQPPPPAPPQNQPDPKVQMEVDARKQELAIELPIKQAEAQAKLAEIEQKKQLAAAQQELALAQIAQSRELLQIELAKARLSFQQAQAKILAPVTPAKNAPVRN